MLELVASETQFKFGQDKYDTLPKYCLQCPVGFACKGECPKNRFIKTPTGEAGLNYLCAGYKAFFQRVDEPMKIMTMLMQDGRPASEVMKILSSRKEALSEACQKTKPDHACPCGSGLLFQECHGWSRSTSNRRRGTKTATGPRPPVRASQVLDAQVRGVDVGNGKG